MTDGNDPSSLAPLSIADEYEATAQPTEESAPVSEEAPSDPAALNLDEFGEHTVSVKVDGEDHMVPVSELREAHMRQADYTQKTQALAEDRKAFDAERQELQGYAKFVSNLQSDPEGTVEALVDHYQLTPKYAQDSNSDLDYDGTDARAKQQDAQIAALTDRLDRVVRDKQIEQEQAVVATEYPDVAPDEILAYAAKNNLAQGQMGLAAKALQAERLIAEKAEFEKATEQIAASKLDLPPVSDGASKGAGVTTKEGDSIDSILDAWKLAGAE